jgi:hypothetical protein
MHFIHILLFKLTTEVCCFSKCSELCPARISELYPARMELPRATRIMYFSLVLAILLSLSLTMLRDVHYSVAPAVVMSMEKVTVFVTIVVDVAAVLRDEAEDAGVVEEAVVAMVREEAVVGDDAVPATAMDGNLCWT